MLVPVAEPGSFGDAGAVVADVSMLCVTAFEVVEYPDGGVGGCSDAMPVDLVEHPCRRVAKQVGDLFERYSAVVEHGRRGVTQFVG